MMLNEISLEKIVNVGNLFRKNHLDRLTYQLCFGVS